MDLWVSMMFLTKVCLGARPLLMLLFLLLRGSLILWIRVLLPNLIFLPLLLVLEGSLVNLVVLGKETLGQSLIRQVPGIPCRRLLVTGPRLVKLLNPNVDVQVSYH